MIDIKELINLIEKCKSIPQCFWSIRRSYTEGCYVAVVRIGDSRTHAHRAYGDDPVEILTHVLNKAREATQ